MLAAYLLGAYVPLERRAGKRERLAWNMPRRAIAITAVTCLLLGTWRWEVLAIPLALLSIEAIRTRLQAESAASFFLEHGAPLAVLFGLACCIPDAASNGWWMTGLKPDLRKWYFATLTCASGIVLCVPAGGILIARLIAPFNREIRENEIAGLMEGGRYIGWLERILVMLLVLMNQPNGIGFLIAAKSILRFGEIKDASQRKVAEYIIIGTFLSFGWALLIAMLMRNAIQYWIP
jgi:hypothetical protein